jgi:hypothetical protein
VDLHQTSGKSDQNASFTPRKGHVFLFLFLSFLGAFFPFISTGSFFFSKKKESVGGGKKI